MSAACGSQAAVGPAPTHLSVTSGWSRRPHSTTCWPPGGEGPGWSAAAEGTSPWSLAPQLQTNPIQAWPSSGPIMSHPWDGGEGMRGGCTPGLSPVVCCATGHQPCGSDPVSFTALLLAPGELRRGGSPPVLSHEVPSSSCPVMTGSFPNRRH